MGSKSKSKSSTSTNQTDSRQFRSVEQGVTGEGTGVTSEAAQHSRVNNRLVSDSEIDNSRQLTNGSKYLHEVNRVVARSGGTIKMVDGGAVRAIENVAGFAIDAATGGAFSLAQQAGELASMISENAAETQKGSYQAIESILAEKQSDGDQDNQKILLYVLGAVGVAGFLAMGAKAK